MFINSSLTTSNKYDVNLKFVYRPTLCTIGKGPAAGNMLSSLVLYLPSPPQRFGQYSSIQSSAVEICAQESMKEATAEAVTENDGSSDLNVALDGSWKKQGFESLNGLVSVTSVDTSKLLDVAVLSKYCQTCTIVEKKNMESGKHKCTKNYMGLVEEWRWQGL